MTHPSIGWLPGIPGPDKVPFVETQRFKGTGKDWRIWLLGDVRCIPTHYKHGERTQPCLSHMGACAWCGDPTWFKREEGYGPALLEIRRLPNPHWKPILAILTLGACKVLGNFPHRGRMFDVQREARSPRCSPLKLKLIQVSDPLCPSFDVEPLMKRLWWPGIDHGPVVLPDPLPIPVEEVNRPAYRPPTEAPPLSPADLERLYRQALADGRQGAAEKLAEEFRLRTGRMPEAAPPPAEAEPVEPAEPPPSELVERQEAFRKPGMTPTPEKVMEAYRRRHPEVLKLADHYANDPRIPTEGAGRIISQDTKATLPAGHPALNGSHKAKGGVQ